MKCVYEELSEQECKCFCGGDKAMRSLGNSVGSIGASICNFLEYFGQMLSLIHISEPTRH